jgi:hypothetical protein
MLNRKSIVSQAGCNGVFEHTDMLLATSDCYLSSPLAKAFVPRHPLQGYLAGLGPTLVPAVLTAGDEPQIGSPIVQAVTIDVVDLRSLRGVEDDAVHEENRPITPRLTSPTDGQFTDRINRSAAVEGMPRNISDEMVIIIVNHSGSATR